MRRRGFTLAEMLVVIFLMGIVLTVIITYLQASLRAFKNDQMQARVDREAHLALRHMERFATFGNIRSVVINPGVTSGVSFLSGTDRDGKLQLFIFDPSAPVDLKAPISEFNQDRAIIWQRFLVYYHDAATRTLKFAEVPIVPSIHPLPLKLESYTRGSQPERIIARDVDQVTFDVDFDPVGQVEINPLHATIRTTDTESGYAYTLTRDFVMVNTYFRGGQNR